MLEREIVPSMILYVADDVYDDIKVQRNTCL